MGFNWLTFGFEIINFLVLVWLLHRLLYRPVLALIERRRAAIEAQTEAAKALQAEAEQRKAEYDRRLEEWSKEQAAARQALDEEIERKRQRSLQELEAELAERRQREATLRARETAEARRAAEREALALAGRFAARLLTALAGPDLQTRLVTQLVQGLATLPSERRRALQDAMHNVSGALRVASAYPLDAAQRDSLIQALNALAAGNLPAVDYQVDAALIAGVRLQLGAWQLGANLQDELQAFGELVDADG